LYPVLFLLLLAADRRWRDAAAVVALALLVNLASLLCFHGGVVTNAELFLRNVLIFSRGYGNVVTDSAWNLSFANLLRVPHSAFLNRYPRHLAYSYPVLVAVLLAGLFRALRAERVFWKRVLAVTVAQIAIPGISPDYNLIYLFIPLLLYLRKAG